MNDLFAALPTSQRKLLEVVWGPMRDENRWPNWNYVESEMYRAGYWNPERILREMPAIGGSAAHEPQYSAIWFDRHNLMPDSVIALTIAASIHLVDYLSTANRMIVAIKYLVLRLKEYHPSPYQVEDPTVTSEEFAAATSVHSDFVRIFPDLLKREPFGLAGTYSQMPNGAHRWRISLRKSLLRYDGITSPREYIERVGKEMALLGNSRDDTARKSTVVGASVTASASGTIIGNNNYMVEFPVSAPSPSARPRVPGRGFYAHMLTTLIASPGDTRAEREVVEQVVLEVNATHMRSEGRGLLPLRYERDVVTGLGARPQELINKVADAADVVVALFRARLGTPSGDHQSGTVEEIVRAKQRNVPVHIFFLEYGLGSISDIDPDQLARLKEWRDQLQTQGLYDVVASIEELQTRLRHHLVVDLQQYGEYKSEVAQREPHRVSWVAEMQRESPSVYTLILTPNGSVAVDDVRVRPAKNALSGNDLDPPVLHKGGREYAGIDRLAPGQPMTVKTIVSEISARNFNLELSWREGGEERQESLSMVY